MAFTPEQIRSAVETSLAQGFSMDQVYQGALANFGVSREEVDRALGMGAVDFALQNQMDVSGLDYQQGWSIPAGEQNGTFYSISGNNVTALTPNPSGIGARQVIYDLQGNVIEDAFLENFGKRNPITDAFVGGTLGLALGPAALGLSAPTAAAIAAGAPRLNETGSLTEAAKAAALAAAAAYGAQSLGQSLFTNRAYDTAFAAADAAQLASQGLDAAAIAQNLSTYVDPSVAVSLATKARDAFLNLPEGVTAVSPTDIVEDLQFQRTRGQSGQVTTSPGAVEVAGSRLTGTTLPTAAATGGGLLGGTVATLPSTVPSPNRVEVPGSRLPTENLTVDDLLAVLSPAITGALPPVTGGTTQQVGVTGSREPVSTTPGTVGGAVGAIIPGITPAVPTGTERVDVTAKKETGGGTIPAVVGATLPTIPATVTQPLPEVVKPPATKEESLFTPSDILKLLTLLGGSAAAGGMTGGGTTPVMGLPPSDTMIGSTTPQFGPDYYAAVQQYYNAFMPETPRNVAGPLQQWYENKFGA